MTGVKPADSLSSAYCTVATCSARGRRAGRRSASPIVRAPRSMSITAPARSRWSRGSKSNSGCGRRHACSSRPPRACRRRPPCGRFGRASMRRLEGRVGLAQLPSSSARRSRNSAAAAISAAASRPARLASPIACAAHVALGAQLVDLRLQRAPPLVQREHIVQPAVGLAPGERRAHALGLGTDQPDVEQRAQPNGGGLAREWASASSSCATPCRGPTGSRRRPRAGGARRRSRPRGHSRPSPASRGRSRRRQQPRPAPAEKPSRSASERQAAGLRDAGGRELEEVRQRLRHERAAAEGRGCSSSRRVSICSGQPDGSDLRRRPLRSSRPAGRRCAAGRRRPAR